MFFNTNNPYFLLCHIHLASGGILLISICSSLSLFLQCGLLFPSFIRLFYSYLNFSDFSSVQFSHSVVSDSLRPHELQHARPPCPSPTPGIHPNPCPLSWWCHPVISSSVIPFSSCPQSFPASGSFPMSQLFASGGQSIGLQHQSFPWIFRVDFL